MVAWLLVLVSAPACGGSDEAGSPPPAELADASGSETYRLEGVADGVYATVVRDGISPSRFAASLIVIRSDHVLVVDSRHDDASADELITTVRGLTDLPVKYLVNTHWHGDHVQGNARFRAVFPDVRLIGGTTAVEDMRTLGQRRLDEQVARGAAPEGLQLVPPEITVEHELRLDDAEPAVEIVKVGPAHTRGDVVVVVPDREVIAIGDLIEDGFPWFGDGSPAGWADALDRVAGMLDSMDAPILLGAHGPVLRDREMFDTQRAFVRRIVDAAAGAVAAGTGVKGAITSADLDGFRDHFTRRMEAADDAAKSERFAAFVTEVMERAYAEASGESEGAP